MNVYNKFVFELNGTVSPWNNFTQLWKTFSVPQEETTNHKSAIINLRSRVTIYGRQDFRIADKSYWKLLESANTDWVVHVWNTWFTTIANLEL